MATCSLHKNDELRNEIFTIIYQSELEIQEELKPGGDIETARNNAEKATKRFLHNLEKLESQPQG